MSTDNNITKLRESVRIDEAKAKAILESFSQEVVTHQTESRLLNNIKSFFTMEGNGITMAFKIMALIVVLGVFAVVGNNLGWYTPKGVEIAQSTPTPTPTATVSIIEDSKDVELVAEEVDKAIAEIDDMQKELDTLALSLSTTEIDGLGTELDSIK